MTRRTAQYIISNEIRLTCLHREAVSLHHIIIRTGVWPAGLVSTCVSCLAVRLLSGSSVLPYKAQHTPATSTALVTRSLLTSHQTIENNFNFCPHRVFWAGSLTGSNFAVFKVTLAGSGLYFILSFPSSLPVNSYHPLSHQPGLPDDLIY